MKSINIEILMGHSIGISDSYYKLTENELLTEYLKAIKYLMVGDENRLQDQVSEILSNNQKDTNLLNDKIIEKESEIEKMKQQIKSLLKAQREIWKCLKEPDKLMQIT